MFDGEAQSIPCVWGALVPMRQLWVHLGSPPPPQMRPGGLIDRTGLSLGKSPGLLGLSTSVSTVSGMYRPIDRLIFQEKPAFKKFRRPPSRL